MDDNGSFVDLVTSDSASEVLINRQVVPSDDSDIEEIVEVKKCGPAQKTKRQSARKTCRSALQAQTISPGEAARTSANVTDLQEVMLQCGVTSPVIKYTDLKKSLGISDSDSKENMTPPPSLSPQLEKPAEVKLPGDIVVETACSRRRTRTSLAEKSANRRSSKKARARPKKDQHRSSSSKFRSRPILRLREKLLEIEYLACEVYI